MKLTKAAFWLWIIFEGLHCQYPVEDYSQPEKKSFLVIYGRFQCFFYQNKSYLY